VSRFVLFAEDKIEHVELLKYACKRIGLSDESFVIARDGLQALSFLRHDHENNRSVALPFLVITDIDMPLMDGLRLLGWIRERPELKGLPVHILTGNASPENEKRARALGCTGFHQKPGDLQGLISLLRELLESEKVVAAAYA
jgi:CheY-like chemotaxis protein